MSPGLQSVGVGDQEPGPLPAFGRGLFGLGNHTDEQAAVVKPLLC